MNLNPKLTGRQAAFVVALVLFVFILAVASDIGSRDDKQLNRSEHCLDTGRGC